MLCFRLIYVYIIFLFTCIVTVYNIVFQQLMNIRRQWIYINVWYDILLNSRWYCGSLLLNCTHDIFVNKWHMNQLSANLSTEKAEFITLLSFYDRWFHMFENVNMVQSYYLGRICFMFTCFVFHSVGIAMFSQKPEYRNVQSRFSSCEYSHCAQVFDGKKIWCPPSHKTFQTTFGNVAEELCIILSSLF